MSLTAGDAVYTGDRRKQRLGPLLKSGGAGSVYPLVESPTQVAKIYHDGTDHAEHERKVAAMLYLSPNLPDLIDDGRRYAQIAWPQSLVRDASGRFVGFLMPAIDVQSTAELECVLQERQAKAAGLPSGLGAKITLAANLAAVIAELHRQGHHVVDLKPVNVRFYANTLYMAILDCDGFSIQGQGERFLAHQVTPDYLAPEFQNQRMPESLEEQQDRFALAVVIFQLLNFGIHPFTGRPSSDRVPTDIPGRIAQRCYAYGMTANPDLTPSLVSGHQSMPADLRSLFDRAFGGAGTNRPSASEWASALRVYAQRSNQRLVLCARDRSHQHFAGLPCAACARAALIANTARDVEAAKSASLQAALVAAQSSAWTRGTNPQQPGNRKGGLGLVPPARTAPSAPSAPPSQPHIGPTWPRRLSGTVLSVTVALCLLVLRSCLLPGRAPYLPPSNAQQVQPQPSLPSNGNGATGSPFGGTSALADATTPEGAIRRVLGAAGSGQGAAVSAALANLKHVARTQDLGRRRDYAQQVERGVLALESADRNNASVWFMQAIADDPNGPEGWFGLAIAARDESTTISALAMAEFVRAGTISGKAMPKQFSAQMLSPLGIDANRFDEYKARAQLIAARLKAQGDSPGAGNAMMRSFPPR